MNLSGFLISYSWSADGLQMASQLRRMKWMRTQTQNVQQELVPNCIQTFCCVHWTHSFSYKTLGFLPPSHTISSLCWCAPHKFTNQGPTLFSRPKSNSTNSNGQQEPLKKERKKNTHIQDTLGARDRTQWVECLPSMHKAEFDGSTV